MDDKFLQSIVSSFLLGVVKGFGDFLLVAESQFHPDFKPTELIKMGVKRAIESYLISNPEVIHDAIFDATLQHMKDKNPPTIGGIADG